jgi:hypothetical protein
MSGSKVSFVVDHVVRTHKVTRSGKRLHSCGSSIPRRFRHMCLCATGAALPVLVSTLATEKPHFIPGIPKATV